MKKGYSPPLQVVEFIATRRGDPERGPMVKIRPDDALERLIEHGEIAWVYGPRRNELATIVVDDTVPRGSVIVRDITGVAPSEMVRIIKVELRKTGSIEPK
jgi:anaerobic selenocysteine-containing dehydrogenase